MCVYSINIFNMCPSLAPSLCWQFILSFGPSPFTLRAFPGKSFQLPAKLVNCNVNQILVSLTLSAFCRPGAQNSNLWTPFDWLMKRVFGRDDWNWSGVGAAVEKFQRKAASIRDFRTRKLSLNYVQTAYLDSIFLLWNRISLSVLRPQVHN